MNIRLRVAAGAALAIASCTQQPTPDLSASLKGIDKQRFLSCSGPPAVEFPQGGQDRMSFLTDLRRGSMIGVTNPAAAPTDACSVDAVFENDRLVSSSFSGNQGMCTMVFAPCLPK